MDTRNNNDNNNNTSNSNNNSDNNEYNNKDDNEYTTQMEDHDEDTRWDANGTPEPIRNSWNLNGNNKYWYNDIW